jgi:hypothetical protein
MGGADADAPDAKSPVVPSPAGVVRVPISPSPREERGAIALSELDALEHPWGRAARQARRR